MLSAGAKEPVSPQRALHLPESIHPALGFAPVSRMTAGSLTVLLEVTPLGQIRQRFGGTIEHSGGAGNASSWLCYASKNTGPKPLVFWFVSNSEMSGGGQRVTQVAVQADPSGAVPEGCSWAPASLTGVDLGIPSVGSPILGVTRYFGGGKVDAQGYLGYASETSLRGPKKATSTQAVQYRIRRGIVDTVRVSQVTAY